MGGRKTTTPGARDTWAAIAAGAMLRAMGTRGRIGFMVLVAIALGPAARVVSAGTVRKPRLDLEVRCATIRAFDYDPTQKELQDALNRLGARGATRLDLGLTHEARPAAPESLPDDSVPSGE